jgi:hypothetical protein
VRLPAREKGMSRSRPRALERFTDHTRPLAAEVFGRPPRQAPGGLGGVRRARAAKKNRPVRGPGWIFRIIGNGV